MSAPSASPISFSRALLRITAPGGLEPDVVRASFDSILAGAWSPSQVAGFLVALRVLGETAPIIAAAAGAMRDAMVGVEHGLPQTLDTCGTGGDGLGTLNVSTGAALVVAALGIPVAKHGNRAASSKTGSADVIEALGIPLDLSPAQQATLLREVKIAFLFAPAHHPAMRHVAKARQELGVRTLFNALGPLANPARASHQLIGTYDDALRPIMAETLRLLGTRRAWLVRGADGLDEVSPTGPTRVTELVEGTIAEREVVPEDFGLPRTRLEDLAGGDPQHNAGVLAAILAGREHPARPAIVLNAAAALVIARGITPREATAEAESALASGRALQTLDLWREAARDLKGSA